MKRALHLTCVAGGLAISVACAGGELQRPVPLGPVSGSLAEVRQQLEGKWTLTSFAVSTLDGRRADVDASGELNADGFGNLSVEYRLSDAGRKTLASLGIETPNAVISTTGSVVIDPASKRITYVGEDFEKRSQGFDPELARARGNPFALERIRYYDFGTDGTLRLSTRYDNGQEAGVGVWRKSS